MCGIGGFSRTEGRSSIPDGRRFARAVALAIESRGRHATGFGWHDPDGSVWYWKDARRAEAVVKVVPLPQGLRTAIVHTRHATTGSPSVEENNHPVIAEGLALIHNGRCANDGELFALLGMERFAEVDSAAIAALLAYGPTVLGATHPTELLELVEGVASLAWLDSDDPDVLHLARLSTRPLTIGWTRRGDLVFSSTPQTLLQTATLARVKIARIEPLPEGTYLRVEAGQIVERRSFVVHHPTALVPDDRPFVAQRRKDAPIQRSESKRLRLDDDYSLDDFDRWLARREQQADRTGLWDGDVIDWDNLVPRRGWR